MKKLPLALSLALVLAACGDDDAKAPATEDTAANAPAETATPPVVAAADRPADTQPLTTPDRSAFNGSFDQAAADDAAFATKLDQILAAEHRVESKVRDAHRHPKETLMFFGVKPGQTVVEITPGGGWYTEILAPLMRNNGKLVAAIWDDTVTGQPEYRYTVVNNFKTMLAMRPNLYDQVAIEPFTPPGETSLGEPGSADVVLTFRNVHNWIEDKSAPAIFKSAFDVLKPGGVLGVTEHRAAAGKTVEETFKSGYLPEEAVIKLATDAGFVLEEKSEINANPKDTKDHPQGVWTLPPTLALKDQDREKYVAIGESDRMTLRFRKPAQ